MHGVDSPHPPPPPPSAKAMPASTTARCTMHPCTLCMRPCSHTSTLPTRTCSPHPSLLQGDNILLNLIYNQGASLTTAAHLAWSTVNTPPPPAPTHSIVQRVHA